MATIEAVPDPRATGAAAVFSAAAKVVEQFRFLRPGHEVSSVLHGDGTNYELVIDVRRSSAREPAHVKRLGPAPLDELGQHAGHWIYARLLAEPRLSRRTPLWEWWDRDGKALTHYQAGKRQESRGNSATALAEYRKAVAYAPHNVSAHLRIGTVLEATLDAPSRLDAMLLYVRLAQRWPELVRPAYRLAVSYLAVDHWVDGWNADEERRAKIAPLINFLEELPRRSRVSPDQEIVAVSTRPAAPAIVTRQFLLLALDRWADLKQSFRSAEAEFGRGKDADAARRALEIAAACSPLKLHLLDDATDKVAGVAKEVERLLTQPWLPWQEVGWRARYNAACFFAIGLRSERHRSRFIDRCHEELRRIVRDKKIGGELLTLASWIENDPELKAVREDPAFATWREVELDLLKRQVSDAR